MYRLILLTLTFCALSFGAYASSRHHNQQSNAAAAASAVAGAPAASIGSSIMFPSGTAGGLSNGWYCAVSNSITLGPIGFGWTDDNELCVRYVKALFACSEKRDECDRLGTEFLTYKPEKAPEPDMAAE